MRRSPDAREVLHVPSMDGFRGVAVLWIVLQHCWGALARYQGDGPVLRAARHGLVGVDMLFLVSGFVLFLPVVLEKGLIGDAGDYLRRRAARIVPAFWAALVVTYPVAEYLGEAEGGAGSWLTHLLFLHNYAHPREHIGFGLNRAMWTMTVEVMFYVTLLFVARWYYRHPFVGLGLAVGMAELWHLAAIKLPVLLGSLGIAWGSAEEAQYRLVQAFPSYLPQFAIGMTAAWLFVHYRQGYFGKLPPQLVTAAAAAGLVGLIGVIYLKSREFDQDLNGPFDPWISTLDHTMLLGLVFLATALASSRVQWPVTNGFSRLVGTASYGIYLSHMVLIALIVPAIGMDRGPHTIGDYILLPAVVVPLSIAVGIVSYQLLEQPFRRWARGTRASSYRVRRREAALAGTSGW